MRSAVRPGHGHRRQLPAPADRRRRTSPPQRALHLRRRARRADRLRAARTSASPTTRRRSCRCCAGPRQLNPRLTVMATPWSPPAWMKTTDSLVGGRLKDDPRIYAAYARYLVKFVQAYRGRRRPGRLPHGAERAAEPAAERLPGHGHAGGAGGQGHRGARTGCCGRRARGPGSSAYDHNWSTHPDDIATTPPGEDPETDYPYEVLDSPAARWVAGTAYHCYFGDPSAQTALHDAYPGQGHLVHRVLRLARPDRPAGASSSATR